MPVNKGGITVSGLLLAEVVSCVVYSATYLLQFGKVSVLVSAERLSNQLCQHRRAFPNVYTDGIDSVTLQFLDEI